MLAVATVLLTIAGAGNVLAEGVRASTLGLYIGLPGQGGRLAVPRSDRAEPLDRAARRLLITTAERAPDLMWGWETAARAAIDMNPKGNAVPAAPRYTVVLTETHVEGRLHTVAVHPEDLEAHQPVHPGPTHREGGMLPWRGV